MDDDLATGKAEKKAFRLLTLRAHSEKELCTKLRNGGFVEPVIVRVIERCRELGYLDDRAFARQRARELAVNRLQGDRRIAIDLRERGISDALGRVAIAEIREEIGEEEAVDRLLRKKGWGDGCAMDNREKARLIKSLAGKGFPLGLIYRKLNRRWEEGVHGDEWE